MNVNEDIPVLSVCPFCKGDITAGEFRDALSIREYRISGLCQKCQDQVFDML